MSNKRMGGSSVDANVLGVKFSDDTYQTTAGVPIVDDLGNSIVSDATGITMTDYFGNMFQMSDGAIYFSLDNSGGGFGMFFDGTNFGISMSDGNGNALLIGDGFGNFNLSNESGHAGIISTTGDICYVYGNPLFVGVAGGFGLTISPSGVSIPTFTPASSSAAGTAGTIEWDSSYIYVCTAMNQWKRAALSTW